MRAIEAETFSGYSGLRQIEIAQAATRKRVGAGPRDGRGYVSRGLFETFYRDTVANQALAREFFNAALSWQVTPRGQNNEHGDRTEPRQGPRQENKR